MKLKIRYDNEYRTLELDEEAVMETASFLSIDPEGLSDRELATLIREKWEEEYNRPEYNAWRRYQRNLGATKAQMYGDENGSEDDVCDGPGFDEVFDQRIFLKDELAREEQESYEEICDLVHGALPDKPEWVEAFIAVRLRGQSIRSYARRTGQDENNVSHKLARAENRLRKIFQKNF